MILLADENIDATVIARLRAAGHGVLSVAEMDPGVTDDMVLRLANERQALLVTEDKDFGELVFRRELVHAGVILLRMAGVAVHVKAQLLVQSLNEHGAEAAGAFSVLTPGLLRIRKR